MIAVQLPAITVVDEKTVFFLSAGGHFSLQNAFASFSQGTDSPVKALSEGARLLSEEDEN